LRRPVLFHFVRVWLCPGAFNILYVIKRNDLCSFQPCVAGV
jgi:hypothetical protein